MMRVYNDAASFTSTGNLLKHLYGITNLSQWERQVYTNRRLHYDSLYEAIPIFCNVGLDINKILMPFLEMYGLSDIFIEEDETGINQANKFLTQLGRMVRAPAAVAAAAGEGVAASRIRNVATVSKRYDPGSGDWPEILLYYDHTIRLFDRINALFGEGGPPKPLREAQEGVLRALCEIPKVACMGFDTLFEEENRHRVNIRPNITIEAFIKHRNPSIFGRAAIENTHRQWRKAATLIVRDAMKSQPPAAEDALRKKVAKSLKEHSRNLGLGITILSPPAAAGGAAQRQIFIGEIDKISVNLIFLSKIVLELLTFLVEKGIINTPQQFIRYLDILSNPDVAFAIPELARGDLISPYIISVFNSIMGKILPRASETIRTLFKLFSHIANITPIDVHGNVKNWAWALLAKYHKLLMRMKTAGDVGQATSVTAVSNYCKQIHGELNTGIESRHIAHDPELMSILNSMSCIVIETVDANLRTMLLALQSPIITKQLGTSDSRGPGYIELLVPQERHIAMSNPQVQWDAIKTKCEQFTRKMREIPEVPAFNASEHMGSYTTHIAEFGDAMATMGVTSKYNELLQLVQGDLGQFNTYLALFKSEAGEGDVLCGANSIIRFIGSQEDGAAGAAAAGGTPEMVAVEDFRKAVDCYCLYVELLQAKYMHIELFLKNLESVQKDLLSVLSHCREFTDKTMTRIKGATTITRQIQLIKTAMGSVVPKSKIIASGEGAFIDEYKKIEDIISVLCNKHTRSVQTVLGRMNEFSNALQHHLTITSLIRHNKLPPLQEVIKQIYKNIVVNGLIGVVARLNAAAETAVTAADTIGGRSLARRELAKVKQIEHLLSLWDK